MRRRLVLFICTGNTCRSPMAAAYLRSVLEQRSVRDIDVRSAGVMTITGLLASQEAVQVMEEAGVDLRRHRSTQLTPELIHKADLILAMSPFHRQTALRMAEEAKNKTYLLKEFTRSDLKNVQIADPMGCTLEVFKKCFKEIKAACDRFSEHEYVLGRAAVKPGPRASAKPASKSARKSDSARKTESAASARNGSRASSAASKQAKSTASRAGSAKPAKATAKSAASSRPATKSKAKPAARASAKTTAKSGRR